MRTITDAPFDAGSSLSVAVSGGLHTGSVTRTYIRTFDSLAVPTSELIPFTDGGKWRYSGPTAALGAVWDPVQFLRLGGSVTWSGDLEADPSSDTSGEGASYAIPTVFRLGASGVLTTRLSLTVGMSYSDWASSEDGLNPETVAGGVFSYGGGLEWAASGFGDRTLPIRLGIRRADLPFLFSGEQPAETVFSGGFGLNLTQALLRDFGAVAKTDFFNVLVMRVTDSSRFIEDLHGYLESLPGLRNSLARVMPVNSTISPKNNRAVSTGLKLVSSPGW